MQVEYSCTAQITVQQKESKQRIDDLTSVMEGFKRKLIECASDIANTTAGTGRNKSGSEFLDRLKSIKISPEASNAENAKTIKDLLVAWLGCNLQECWALTPWFVRIRNSGIDGYLFMGPLKAGHHGHHTKCMNTPHSQPAKAAWADSTTDFSVRTISHEKVRRESHTNISS